MPSAKANDFLKRLSTDEALQQRVAGVFVGHETPDGDSPDDTFPQAGFMPYKEHRHKWNPEGRGVLKLDFAVPVLLLDNTTGPEALSRAAGNAAQVLQPRSTLVLLQSCWSILENMVPMVG